MPSITPQPQRVFEVAGGIDTHLDTHTAAVIDTVGRVLGTEQFPADASGYAALLDWMRGFGLIAAHGVGADVAGQLLVTAGHNHDRLTSEAAFAMLRGAAPIPASSGKTNRHRLHRGGDRQANAALYRVVPRRPRWDPRTRAYAKRRTTEGMSKKEIIRCLKRYVARELYQLITTTNLDLAA